MRNPLAEDLNHVLLHTGDLWEALRGRRLFITGGTGFFGSWLLESFLWAHERYDLGAHAVVLTRDPKAFEARVPHLAQHPAIECWPGDVRTFPFGDDTFSHVIHAATPTTPQTPDAVFGDIVDGTRRVLDFATHTGAEAFLLTSSGAVYGKQPSDMSHVPEDYSGGPDPLDSRSAYGEGKRSAELLCAAHGHRHRPQIKIARCFAFVGPYLPLDVNFAVGNFIRDGLLGGPIRIAGDGTPYRSYLYAADLAIWLWTILFRGQPLRPYNVGSAAEVNIRTLANVVAETFRPPLQVQQARPETAGYPAERYVPDVTRAEAELELRTRIPLADGIHRTVAWHKGEPPSSAHDRRVVAAAPLSENHT